MKDPETGKWKVTSFPHSGFGGVGSAQLNMEALKKYREERDKRDPSSGSFFNTLFQNRDQGGGSGLQTLLGNFAGLPIPEDTGLTGQGSGLFGGLVPQGQQEVRTGSRADAVNPFTSIPEDMRTRMKAAAQINASLKPVEVAGLGNVVSDPDGSIYGQSASPAIADYMAPQEDVAITKEVVEEEEVPGKTEWEKTLNTVLSANREERLQVPEPMQTGSSGLNQNIPGNIYAKHGGSVFRNAYDQASNIMSGGLEGLKESIDINGQPHNLAYINPSEANLLKVLGGSGQKVNGVPAFNGTGGFGGSWSNGSWSSNGDGNGGQDRGGGDNQNTGIEGVDWSDVPGNISTTPGGPGGPVGGDAGPEGAGGGTPEGVNLGDIPGFESYNVPGSYPAGPGGPDYGINGGMWEVYNKGLTPAQWEFAEKVGGMFPALQPYALNAVRGGKINNSMTGAKIADALSDERANWNAAEFMYGNTNMSDEQKYSYATKYGIAYERGGEEAALYALATGRTVEQDEVWENKAKVDKDARTADIRTSLWADYLRNPDEYAEEPVTLDELMDLNEAYVEEQEFQAVRDSLQASFNAVNMNVTVDEYKFDKAKGIFELGPGILDFAMRAMQSKGKAFNMDDFAKSVTHALMSKAGFSMVDAIAAAMNYIGGLMGEKVIGTATDHTTGLTMNIHESGKMTFQSPEDDPNYDPAAAQEGEGWRKPSRVEAILEEGEKDEEETRSIADLVPKKGSSAKGTDYLLEIYRSIYGPDANPFNIST